MQRCVAQGVCIAHVQRSGCRLHSCAVSHQHCARRPCTELPKTATHCSVLHPPGLPHPAEFWLHPDDVMRFKAEVMRHLPILIYGDRTKLTERERLRNAFATADV